MRAMREHIAHFLAHLRDRNYSPRTVEQYGATLSAFVAFCATLGIDPVTGDALSQFLRAGGIGPATRNAKLAALRTCFRYLERRGVVVRNPAEEVDFAREPEQTPVYLTGSEFRAFQETVARTSRYSTRDEALVAVLYHSGMRIGELQQLDLAMLSWERREFTGARVKGGKVVNLAIGEGAVPHLRRWVLERPRWSGAETAALFLSDRGNRLSVRAVENLFARWSSAAGLARRVTPHKLRHSTATELLRRGVDLVTVAAVLNHASLNTTRKYTHLADGRRHEALGLLAPPPLREVRDEAA